MSEEAEAYARWQSDQALERAERELDGAGHVNEQMGQTITRLEEELRSRDTTITELTTALRDLYGMFTPLEVGVNTFKAKNWSSRETWDILTRARLLLTNNETTQP